ncbi:MAG: hypothetical protein ABIG89_04855 [Candidatus Woesearchaeota archaeon]
MKKLFFIFLFFISFIIFVNADDGSTSFGVSPSYISNDIMLPGLIYTDYFKISTSSEVPLKISIINEDVNNVMNSWISLSKSEFILQPKLKEKIEVNITAPKNIEPGEYKSSILIKTAKLTQENNIQSQLNIDYAVKIPIKIIITDKDIYNRKLIYAVIEPHNVISGNNLLAIFHYINSGNQPINITAATISVYENIGDKILLTENVSKMTPDSLYPFTDKDIMVKANKLALKPDYYKAKFKIYHGDSYDETEYLYFKIVEKKVANYKWVLFLSVPIVIAFLLYYFFRFNYNYKNI